MNVLAKNLKKGMIIVNIEDLNIKTHFTKNQLHSFKEFNHFLEKLDFFFNKKIPDCFNNSDLVVLKMIFDKEKLKKNLLKLPLKGL